MARIDSLLSIVAQQGANELRVGSDREPKMLANGAAKRLAIPAMTTDMMREMLGEILSPEREATMRARGRIEVTHDAGALGVFQVTLAAREAGAFDAVFLRAARREAAHPPAPVAPPVAVAAPGVAAIHVGHVAPAAPAPAAPEVRSAGHAGGATETERARGPRGARGGAAGQRSAPRRR